jgi:endonuclease YncB( thermonuclease family)
MAGSLRLGLLLALLGSGSASADTLTGPARATAPETLVVANARIRFNGYDALPADAICGGRPCAEAAVAHLGELVAAGSVTCERGARAGHGVYAGSCRLADGRDPAVVLAEEGLLRRSP